MTATKRKKKDQFWSSFSNDFEVVERPQSLLVHADCFAWLSTIPDNSLTAVVTDPPYGVKEYELAELHKLHSGGAGIWRLPPAFDGKPRAPLPRFTALNEKERQALQEFFTEFAIHLLPKLAPGAHVFLASNSFLSQVVFSSLIAGGLEFRTEIIRLVQTLRGGDRPKLGEKEFPDVCSLPRGGYEPWGLFRKPMPNKMTVRECLAEFGTGGLRRRSDGKPFSDVLPSERTPRKERNIANHPSLKPQSLLRQIVYASLPLGTGIVADPFMGSGSTIAAAENVGYAAVGVERYRDYFDVAVEAIPKLATVSTRDPGGFTAEDQLPLEL
ncbi:DNA methyltransferase [Hyphomonas sp. ND6WE1B]|uniref:DNA-methyltransferase n=1 Tax=Hyphomonas sp. ND6WE1B TaxID=1848191 RepID=UPI000807634C|nr:DNA methyltransferase [Hyphomonas sp. ND6WE1B]